jgi:carbon-monoxide dehydrogenase small subunit
MTMEVDNRVKITVNGVPYEFLIGQDIRVNDTLSKLLREKLGLTGVRVSCEEGVCGACTVLMNGKAIVSCMMLVVEADGSEILTIEGLADNDEVVKAFAEECDPGYGNATQCGFCTPGFIMETHGLLDRSPRPSKDEIREQLSGHICRCGCYKGIVHAVEKASIRIGEKEGK